MIHLKNTSFFITRNKKIISDISWHIQRDENWVLFGKNGAGKSILLELICGYLYPSKGEIIRFGQPKFGTDIREIRKKIGYVGTYLTENFSYKNTLEDVILSGLFATIGLYDKVTKQNIETTHKLLDTINMFERRLDKFNILSDGEKQKILILRALINHPELLILDEPARGLDLYSREELLETLNNLNKHYQINLIYVTHHIEEITSLFNKIFIINNGECYYQGNIENGLTDRNISSIFNKKINIKKVNNRYYSIIK